MGAPTYTELQTSFLVFFSVTHALNTNRNFFLPLELVKEFFDWYFKMKRVEKYLHYFTSKALYSFIDETFSSDLRITIGHCLCEWPVTSYEIDGVLYGPCEIRSKHKHVTLKTVFRNGFLDELLEIRNKTGKLRLKLQLSRGKFSGVVFSERSEIWYRHSEMFEYRKMNRYNGKFFLDYVRTYKEGGRLHTITEYSPEGIIIFYEEQLFNENGQRCCVKIGKPTNGAFRWFLENGIVSSDYWGRKRRNIDHSCSVKHRTQFIPYVPDCMTSDCSERSSVSFRSGPLLLDKRPYDSSSDENEKRVRK